VITGYGYVASTSFPYAVPFLYGNIDCKKVKRLQINDKNYISYWYPKSEDPTLEESDSKI